MPDYTNQNVVQLIHYVVKRLDRLEEKFKRILEVLDATRRDSIEDQDPSPFDFKPIDDDRDLEYVSSRIETDQNYLEKLITFIEQKAENRHCLLGDLFTRKFLYENYDPSQHLESRLLKLVPFHRIYLYIKTQNGCTEQTITNDIWMELQNLIHCPDNDTAMAGPIPGFDEFEISVHDGAKKNGTENDSTSKNLTLITSTNVQIKTEPGVFLEENENFGVEPFSIMEADPIANLIEIVDKRNVSVVKSPQGNSDFDDEVSFKPISSYDDLDTITYKINNQKGFLKKLRAQIENELNGELCTLETIFEPNFLFPMHLSNQNKRDNKLSDVEIFHTLYLYLRRKCGATDADSMEAGRLELKRLKYRLEKRRQRAKQKMKQDKALAMAWA